MLQKPKSDSARLGELVTLETKLVADPAPLISVYRNDVHLERSERVHFCVVSDGHM